MSTKPDQVNVAITEEMRKDLTDIQQRSGIKPPEIGRQGFAEIIARLKYGTVTPEERRALADFRKVTNADPVVYLREAARTHLAAVAPALPVFPSHD